MWQSFLQSPVSVALGEGFDIQPFVLSGGLPLEIGAVIALPSRMPQFPTWVMAIATPQLPNSLPLMAILLGILLLGIITLIATGLTIVLIRQRAAYHRLQRQYNDLNNKLHSTLHRRDDRLSSTEARFRNVLENMPVMLNAFDAEGNLLLWNAECERITGYRSTEVIGKPDTMDRLYPNADYRQRMMELWQSMGNDFRSWEWELTCKDGSTKTIAWSNISDCYPVAGWATWAIGVDLTQHHRAETALRQAKTAAEQANQAKSRFLAHMSHELRTPLNSILGFSQLLASDYQLSSEQQQQLHIITHSGEHLLRIINDVLEVSKIEANRVSLTASNFDLQELLRRLESSLSLQAKSHGLSLTVNCAAGVPRQIHTDESKLYQILLNLLSNALKFTQQGKVGLNCALHSAPMSVGRGVQESRKDEIVQREPLHLRFTVTDSGSGIAPEDLTNLFQAFSQTEHGIAGTGLGLFISQQFAQILGGNITVESRLGEGSKFHLDLPVQSVSGETVSPPPEPPRLMKYRLSPGQPIPRILIAEDCSTHRQLLWKLLTDAGFKVWQAEQGQEALQLWKAHQPDLILMDMRMPIMDGYETITHLRSHHQSSPDQGKQPKLIALTASALESDRRRILALGYDDFIRKPFKYDQLFRSLGQHLAIHYDKADASTVALPNEHVIVPPPTMTMGWWAALHQAAAQGSEEQVLMLLEQIPQEQQTSSSMEQVNPSAFIQRLRDWAEHYRFDQIMKIAATYIPVQDPQAPGERLSNNNLKLYLPEEATIPQSLAFQPPT